MNVPRPPNVMSSTLSNVLITLRVSQLRYVGRHLGKNNRMAAAEWIFEESLACMLGAVSYSISMSSMGCKLQEGYWSGRGVNCLFRAMERRWWSENKRQRRQISCPLPPCSPAGQSQRSYPSLHVPTANMKLPLLVENRCQGSQEV